jgi:hypothetical protein
VRILSSLVVCFWSFQDGDFCFWRVGNSSGYALSRIQRAPYRETETETERALGRKATGLFFGWEEVLLQEL